LTNRQSYEAPAARQYQEAFAKLDADDTGAIVSFSLCSYVCRRPARQLSLDDLLNGATIFFIQINFFINYTPPPEKQPPICAFMSTP